jgi:hypothetical protein
MLLITVTSFVTLYEGEHFALKNEHGLRLFQSPEISTGNASPAQDTHLTVSYLQHHRTQHDDISPEIPGDKATLLRYASSLMYIFAHTNILRPKWRGIKPGRD